MELSYALTWMIGTGAVFGLVSSLQQLRLGLRGWLYVNLVLLAEVGLGSLWGWDWTGYCALALWLLLVVSPNVANGRLQTAIAQQQLMLAARWANLVAVLHPFDGNRERARWLMSQSRLESGDVAAAKGALYPLLNVPAWTERAKVELLRLDERWSLIAAHAQARAVGTRDLQLAPLYLRAFGEVGDLESMWTMYSQIPPQLANQPALQLQMASYAGCVDLVELLLVRHFPRLPEVTAALVRATALYAAGHGSQAERLLFPIVRRPGSAGKLQVNARLTRPPPRARTGELSAHVVNDLADFERAVRSEASSIIPSTVPRRAWCTTALLASLVLVYLFGIPGGTTDPENLVKLGALVIPSELSGGGTAWRIVAAGFLHLGFTHLVMNCLGLWALGRQIEQLWGGFVLLVIFMTSSVGSFGFAAAFIRATAAEPRIFLGASSGVLGLVGALGTFLATGYLVHRRKTLARRLLLVVAVVLAQLLFDWFTPIVSSMLHLTGLAIGALVAVPYSLRAWRERKAPRRMLSTT